MKLLLEAFAKRTYADTGTRTSRIPRRQLQQIATQIVDHSTTFSHEEAEGEDNALAFEAVHQANYEYRILLGFVVNELIRQGHDKEMVASQVRDYGLIQADMGDEGGYGHQPVMQEAYDTAPIHPYWGGPATPDNTEINPYFTTDFYQALSGGGGDSGGMGGISSGQEGGGTSMAGVEGEEEMNDNEFSLEDGEGKNMNFGSFKDFVGGTGGCGDDEHPDAQMIRGWKLYRIDDEEGYGEEQM